ncbi:MAG: hypothetical protein ACM3VX_02645 [Bacteroidota bacterium]
MTARVKPVSVALVGIALLASLFNASLGASLAADPDASLRITAISREDLQRWDVAWHSQDGSPMPWSLELVETPQLEPLGVAAALEWRFTLIGAWASIETPIAGVPEGASQVVLYIKGNAATPHAFLEAYEQDGTRWRASVRIRTEWTKVVLTPRDFFYLLGGNGRGGPNDKIQLSKLVRTGLTVDGAKINLGDKQIVLGLIVFE